MHRVYVVPEENAAEPEEAFSDICAFLGLSRHDLPSTLVRANKRRQLSSEEEQEPSVAELMEYVLEYRYLQFLDDYFSNSTRLLNALLRDRFDVENSWWGGV